MSVTLIRKTDFIRLNDVRRKFEETGQHGRRCRSDVDRL